VIFFFLQCKIDGLAVLKRAFTALLKMKGCTLLMLCLFVVSLAVTTFLENHVEQFSDSNNFLIYSLSLAIAAIQKKVG